MDVPARVEQLGLQSRDSGVPREENPYLELSPFLRVKADDLKIARELADAWWRGWDRGERVAQPYAGV